MSQTETSPAADAALALELVGQFFAGQISAGAVLNEEIAALLRMSAERVGDAHPALASQAMARAEAMIDRLPEGWADGDDGWVESA